MPFVVALLILSVCFILYLIYENKNLEVTTYLIEQGNVPAAFEGMRFVCLTDLHQNRFGKKNEKLIKHIRNCNPDAILIAGDMITSSNVRKHDIALSLIRELALEYKIYYAPGNHELKWKKASMVYHTGYLEYTEVLDKIGVSYLDNDSVMIKKGHDLLQIVGLNLSLDYYNKGGEPKTLTQEDLNTMIPSADQNSYTILLAHVPDYFEEYVDWGADLIVSGHNHGGIMRLWKIGGVISPRYQLFPKYDAGVFQKRSSVMILSRGLGTHTIPVRIFNRPELVCLQIKKK